MTARSFPSLLSLVLAWGVPCWAHAESTPDGNPSPAPPSEHDAVPEVAMPELLAPLEPEYPPSGTSSARVVLEVTLDRAGAVTRIEVRSGEEPFASAAVRAAQRGRFTPAKRRGEPVAAKITIAVDFAYASRQPAPATPAPTPTSPPARTPELTSNGVDDSPATPEESDLAASPAFDIIVRAERLDVSERQVNSAEARLTAGTFGDPLRAVELLPGISPLISGVPYFYVRGAPAGSVSFYIDEARIPQLYHVGPGSSVMHPQFVEGVALRSGPYRARYGDATSGVITTRLVTDLDQFSAEAEAKMFESSAYVGTPFGDGSGTVAVAGKVSHLRPILKVLNPELHVEYWDYQTVVAKRLTPRDQFTVLLFGAGDFVGQEREGVVDIDLDTEFHRLKLGYNRNVSGGIDLHNHVILGREGTRFGPVDEHFRDRSLGAGSSLHVVLDDSWEWATGVALELVDYDTSDASTYIGQPGNAAVDRTETQLAWWGEGRYSPTRQLHLDAGLRLAGYDSLDSTAMSVEPRLSSTVDWSQHWRSILAVGYSTQTPSAAVPAPAVRPAELRGGLQEALQRALTVSYRIPHLLTAEATAFYNEYRNLSDPLSLSTVSDPLEIGESPDGAVLPQEDLNFTEHPNGRSVGLELLLRRPFTQTISGSLAYTLSRSTRRLGDRDVPSSFDRTHVVNATVGWKLGSGYHASARFLTYSGLPVRQIGITGGRTGERSDPFVRIDFRVSKEWDLDWMRLMLILEMLNATFQEEVLGVSCGPEGCLTATFGPISVPSIGLRGTFGGGVEDSADRSTLR